jgi:hypothetical protein
MCDNVGIYAWPKAGEISPNSIFVLEGYMDSQPLIRQLGKTNLVYLISSNDTIECSVTKRFEGQLYLTQAILIPKRLLISGQTYRLFIDHLNPSDSTEFSWEKEKFEWKVNYNSDKESPKWNHTPKLFYKSFTDLGCGPAIYATFCADVFDNSSVMVLAKIKNLKNDSIAEYYVQIDSNSFDIGHHMCSGPFVFEDSSEYEGTFSLMDASGNISDDPEVTLRFISPSNREGIQSEGGEICECGNIKIFLDKPEPKNLKLFSIIASLGIFTLAIWCMTKMNSWTNQDKT